MDQSKLPIIDITSRNHAELLFKSTESTYDFVISISDPRANPPLGFPSYPAESIALFFDDFVNAIELAPELGYDPPDPQHMEASMRLAG
jgi:hypothetical protein